MAPSRPSGAAKKKPANQEGGQRRGRDRGGGQSHLPRNPLDLAANQHCQTLLSPKSSAKTVDGWLPGGSMGSFLDEKWQQLQRQKMVRGTDLVGGERPPCSRTKPQRLLALTRRAGIQGDTARCGEMGPGSAARHRRVAALRPGHEGRVWRPYSLPPLRAQRSNPESFREGILDCFVASLLTMTEDEATAWLSK